MQIDQFSIYSDHIMNITVSEKYRLGYFVMIVLLGEI